MLSTTHFVVSSLQSLYRLAMIVATGDDVRLNVSSNSVDSPRSGACIALQRDNEQADIVHINVPDSINDFVTSGFNKGASDL